MMLMCFIEGVLSFISPCILPLIPLYISYLGGKKEEGESHLIRNCIGFIFGFTIIFVALGVAASGIGSILNQYKETLKIIGAVIVILMGINFIFPFRFLQKEKKVEKKIKVVSIFHSVLFGMIFAIGWTPCVGPLLASALVKAGSSKTLWEGIVMLLLFSLGLGIPFFITTILYDKLTNAFQFLRKNLGKIKLVSGILLVVFGILMITGVV